jgi:hypothetical protein
MVDFHEEADGKVLVANMGGKLTRDDYKCFLPEVERLIRTHHRVRILCRMHDFHGWTLGALWEDIKFDVRHFADIERLAIVGERRWQHGMAVFCEPFTKAEVRYFDDIEFARATEWILADLPIAASKSRRQPEASAARDAVQEASEESFPASDAPAY